MNGNRKIKNFVVLALLLTILAIATASPPISC
jgi:hypothetical protein